MFRSYVVREHGKGNFRGAVEENEIAALPAGDLLIRVHYSSLNYKDALSASGNRGITRRYPHTPGIDAAGVVVESTDPQFSIGEDVVVSGYDMGMNYPGGFADYIRVPGCWAVKLPSGLTLLQSMMFGTAGFTAGRCVETVVRQGCRTGGVPVLVTGATGGVGSISVAILSRLGYSVTTVTGKDEATYLRKLGAQTVLKRGEFLNSSKKALLPEKWAAVIDTVGGQYLETAIKETCYDGVVASCGNASSGELSLTVYPFIIRGVQLIGVDAARCSLAVRRRVWELLAGEYRIDQLDSLASIITLEELPGAIERMLDGGMRGRIVVRMVE